MISVRIDVDQLLRDREAERMGAEAAPDGESAEEVKPELLDGTVPKQKSPRKRKSDATDGAPRPKKPRTKPPKSENAAGPSSPSKPPKVTLKLGPKPQESDVFPCCLCVSSDQHGLLRVHNPPLWQKGGQSGDGPEGSAEWKAHEECANVIPETWIDEIEVGALPDGTMAKERMVFGTDAIPKDRWNLVSRVPVPISHQCAKRLPIIFRSVTLARRRVTELTARRYSVLRASVRKHTMSLARGMAPTPAYRTKCLGR